MSVIEGDWVVRHVLCINCIERWNCKYDCDDVKRIKDEDKI